MVKNGVITGRYFLVLNRFKNTSLIIFVSLLLVSNTYAQETPAKLNVDKRMLKNFMKSLILPGWGQWENGNKIRGILYVTAEIAGIYGYQSNMKAGDDKAAEFKIFGDEHWDYTVWSFSDNGETACNGNLRTHNMPTYVDENFVIQPIKDHHFYENISKYPEFVCGWDDWDPNSSLADEDLSPNKMTYVDMRTLSNQLYRNG